AGQFLAHAGTAGQVHDAGLTGRVPAAGLLAHFTDRRESPGPAVKERRERDRQRPVKSILHRDRGNQGLIDDERMCHWCKAFKLSATRPPGIRLRRLATEWFSCRT